MRGKFIAFEGIDSEVITDQTRRMSEWLRSKTKTVITTREPTDGPIGAQIRLILDKRLLVSELPQAAFFVVDRVDHLYRRDDGILAELEREHWVVCARYLLSAYAYQSDIAPFEWLVEINRLCPWPDLMVFVDTTVESSLERMVRQEGFDSVRIEERLAELTSRRESFLNAINRCRSQGKEVSIVDGNQPAANIHRSCKSLVDRINPER